MSCELGKELFEPDLDDPLSLVLRYKTDHKDIIFVGGFQHRSFYALDAVDKSLIKQIRVIGSCT
jgi:hypothetical protein